MEEDFKKAALCVFVCGLLLRVALALVNSEANDIHMNVIKVMAYQNRIPEINEDREAFQPKLYHATVAALLKIVRPQSGRAETILAQLVSCTAGIFTLLLAYRFFMSEVEVSEKVRLIAFSLLALNPVLIGINAQATNDSFVILFGSLAFYFGWHFFQSQRSSDFGWMLVSAIFAGLSKGSGMVIFLAILATFAMAVLRTRNNHYPSRRMTALYGLLFLVSYFALVPTLGPYWDHHRRYGSAFKINQDPDPLPITSIADSLFTFRLIDMLRNPVIITNIDNRPQTQTSLWSELYGRTHFVHFDAWPPSWQAPPEGDWPYGSWARPLVFNIGRVIFVCALLPTLLMLTGLLRSLFSVARSLITAQAPTVGLSDWLLNFATLGYVLFIIVLRLRFRQFGAMKAIYIFPGFFAFLIFFARECDHLYVWLKEKKALRLFPDTVFTVLLFLYVIDVAFLVGQLGLGVAYQFLHGTDIWNALRVFFRGP